MFTEEVFETVCNVARNLLDFKEMVLSFSSNLAKDY